MTIELIGLTLEAIGSVIIGYTVIAVHRRFWKEHKVDERVFSEMKKEQIMGLVGLGLMIAGFLIQGYFKLYS